MDTNDKDLGDKKFNNAQQENSEQEFNEGFSGENIPKDYNPSDEKLENRMRSEIETDQNGNNYEVKRARYTDKDSDHNAASENPNADNSTIQNKTENRDRNYDDAKRYPYSHPDNHENRGNVDLDNE